MEGLSPARIAIVILYRAVKEAPIVKIGIQVIINNKLTIIRLQSPVRNLVAVLLGLKNEGRDAGAFLLSAAMLFTP